MSEVWVYTLASVILVSLVSFVGILTLSLKLHLLNRILLFLVSFSAGALLGDAFIHLIPGVVEISGFGLETGLYLLLGILTFFVLEQFIHWRHCHIPTSHDHPHPFALMNLIGDGLHNLIDGLIIGGSYLVSIPLGIATTIAVLIHEIPQEIGDFGVLLHGGFSKSKALFYNFLIALLAVVGAVISLLIGTRLGNYSLFLIPFTAGAFIYIASADLIPELHKKCKRPSHAFLQFLSLVAGMAVMLLLLFLE